MKTTLENEERCHTSSENNNSRAAGKSSAVSPEIQTPQQLQDSIKFYKEILDSVSAHIAVIDDEGEIITVNNAWDKFAINNDGVPFDPSIGSNYFDVCVNVAAEGEKDAGLVRDGILSVIRNEEKFFDLEYPCHSPSEKRWFVMHVEKLGNDSSHIVISHQDISALKQTEASLRESESNLQDIFDHTTEGFILVDLAGDIKLFNNKAREIFFINSGKNLMEGESVFNYVDESRREAYTNIIPMVASGHDAHYDIPFTRTNGLTDWFLFTITRVMKNGSAVGFSISGQDISERKRMEELLTRSQSNLTAIIDNTDSFIYSLNTEFQYITYNTALSNMMSERYGITIAPGYPVFDFIDKYEPEKIQEWKDIYSRALKGEIIHFDREFILDPHYVFTSFSIHPIWGHDEVIGLSCFVNDRTQEKLAEKAVRQAELRYRQIVETAQEGIWLTNEHSQTVFVNNKLCEILGYQEEEFFEKDMYAFMDDEGMEFAASALQGREKGGNVYTECMFISKKHDQVWTNLSANSIFDEAGEYKGSLFMISDITERRKLKNLLDLTNEMARIGSYEAEFGRDAIYWSAMTREILEVSDEFIPLLNNQTSFFKEGTSRDAIKAAYSGVRKNNIPFDLELPIITAKGNERWARLTGKGKFIDGICVSIYGSFQDVDKMKRAELEILKVYEERNIILESIDDAFFATNKNWIVTYWNKKAEKLLGQPKTAMLGNCLWDVFPHKVGLKSYQHFVQAIEKGQSVTFNDYYKTLNTWFEISAFPSAAGLSVYYKDITDRKNAEAERARILTDITQRNKDLEQFSYIVSHNLRAPVANIIGLAEELNADDHSIENKAWFTQELLSSATRLDNVITDLNSILQTKRELSEKKEPVILSELVDNIKSSIRHLIETKNAVITADFTQVNTFTTVKTYLYSIFYNLISNSIKYHQPGISPLIHIKTLESEKELAIVFTDNGSGINLAKNGDMVFGLYKRFHKDIEGKGMGLFMVKTHVETLGGKISVQSTVNKGTEFTLTFEHKI